MYAKITALGSYVPPKKLTNHDLTKIVDTSVDWIIQRTGIEERRIVDDETFTTDLCEKAALDLSSKYKKKIYTMWI